MNERCWRPGDIAACYGADRTSRLISAGTASLMGPPDLRWPPSHVAIICHAAGGPLWVESTTLCPRACVIRGAYVSGVQAHNPSQRAEDYIRAGGRVELYRLTAINKLCVRESQLLSRLLLHHFVSRGIGYDLGGALLSGTRVFQLSRLFPAADLDRLFCSELIAAVLMRLGRLNHANPTRFHPGRLLRTLVRTGKYQRVARFPGGAR